MRHLSPISAMYTADDSCYLLHPACWLMGGTTNCHGRQYVLAAFLANLSVFGTLRVPVIQWENYRVVPKGFGPYPLKLSGRHAHPEPKLPLVR